MTKMPFSDARYRTCRIMGDATAEGRLEEEPRRASKLGNDFTINGKYVAKKLLYPLYAVSIWATSSRCSSCIDTSRILNFWIFPVTLMGKPVTNFTWRGIL